MCRQMENGKSCENDGNMSWDVVAARYYDCTSAETSTPIVGHAAPTLSKFTPSAAVPSISTVNPSTSEDV